MKTHVDRWALLLAALTALALLLAGCGEDDQTNEEGDTGELPIVDDDNAADDDDNDDNDDDNDADSIAVTPPAQVIPAGTAFAFTAEGVIDGAPVTEGFAWSVENEAIATIDQTGVATGVANGVTKIYAAIGEVQGEATIRVGPDAYSFDNLSGTLTAIDRGSQTGVNDLLAKRAAIGVVLQDIKFYDGKLLLTDSADWGYGITSDEKLVVVDALELTATNHALNMDNPWGAAAEDGAAYVTGNLDNQLAEVDLESGDVTYFALDDPCTPADALALGGMIYIACTGFHLDDLTYDPGKVLVFNPETGQIAQRIDAPQLNPTRFAATADGSKLYVVCTGDFNANTGKIAQIDPSSNTVVDSFDLGIAPGPIGIAANGMAFVGEGFAGSVYVFNTADNSVLRGADDPLTVPDALWIQGLGVHPETGDLYVCDQGGSRVRVFAGSDPFGEVFSVELPNPGGVAFW
jgi:DNA-binding beta-propeller fold protein YncE